MSAILSNPSLARLQRIGLPIGAVLLTLFFVAVGFPYDRVRDLVAARAGQALQARVRMASLGPSFSLLGPGVHVTGLDATLANGQRVTLDEATVRPAWSTSWLRGRPSLHVDVSGALGRAAGTLTLGAEPGFDGDLYDVDLAKLPLESALSGLSLDGIATGSVDVQRTATGPRGRFDLEAKGGSVALPGIPVALPFETLAAKALLTDQYLAEGLAVNLQGPMLTAQISGNVGQAPMPMAAPLDLQVRVQVVDPSLQPMLAGTGLRFGPDGSADMKLTGTAGRPLLR